MTQNMLTTANRCNLMDHRPTRKNLERIKMWHNKNGYSGGITYRHVDSSDTTVYDKVAGETERHRRESFYIYYEIDPHGNRKQEVFVRGTAITSDVFHDVCYGKEFDKETGQYFHRGFLLKADSVLADLESLLDERATLYVAGHSLGGAVAAIIAWKLHARGYTISEVMSFGGPKFCTVRSPPFKLSSIAHECDPIPALPPDGPTALFRGYYCPTGEQLRLRHSIDSGMSLFRIPQLPYWRHHALNASLTSGVDWHRMYRYENCLSVLVNKTRADLPIDDPILTTRKPKPDEPEYVPTLPLPDTPRTMSCDSE